MTITQKISLTAFMFFSPLFLFAAGLSEVGGSGKLEEFGADITNFINNTLVPFVFAVALLLFIYGVYLYFIQGGGDDTKRAEGRKYIIWAILTFVVMVSVWGITTLIANGLGFGKGETIDNVLPKPITPAGS